MRRAQTPVDFAIVRALFTEYRGELGDQYAIGGCGLDEEIAALPGAYLEPDNFVLLAYKGGRLLGCLALKRFDTAAAEVKRMYVRPEGRGQGIGQKLLAELIDHARALGYRKLYLDSLHKFRSAHRIYRAAGFRDCPPYDPATTQEMREHMLFMEKDL